MRNREGEGKEKLRRGGGGNLPPKFNIPLESEGTKEEMVYSNQKQLLLLELGSIPNESAVLLINTLPFEM